MSLLQNSNAIETSAAGYNINNSLRFRSAGSTYLNKTFTTPTSSTIWTWSAWVKRGALTGTFRLFGASTTTFLTFNSTDQLNLTLNNVSAATSTAVFRDPSAWYHIVYTQNGSAQTIYVNNESVATGTTAASVFNTAISHQIGAANTSNYFDGYMTEVNFIDGQALTPSSFGSTNTTTGVWQPAKYTGTYGINGFYLNFSDIALTSGSNAGLGKDNSGNANYFNTNNISVTTGRTYDAMTDVPTLTSATVANYAVINPIATTGVTNVASNGNLRTNSTERRMYSSIGVSSGKWYFEYTVVSTNIILGIGNDLNIQGNTYTGILAYSNAALKYNGATTSAYGATYAANDVIGVALDLDAGTLEFYKNNVSQGVAFTGLTGTYYASPITGSSGACFVNFGQQPFVYTPPTGYVAINTYNLADSTVVKGNTVMDATLYTGTGATLAVTNAASFQPDLVWIKGRSGAANHGLHDSVRGTAGGILVSNSTAAESSGGAYISSLNSNGFTVNSNTSGNGSAATYVGWQWQAGQGSTSSNTDGSITSTVSANPTAGFSVVTYTGTGANATVGHGLAGNPKMIIVKGRSNVDNWQVYHSGLTSAAYRILLNSTAAQTSQPAVWNSTAPTSSVFSLGTGTSVNQSGQTFVAYCWGEVPGFSKFGSYTGNGSANGPFVYLGFRPAFIMMKRTASTSNWVIYDNKRPGYNVINTRLYANISDAESTNASLFPFDILSNGFKIRGTSGDNNTNGAVHIYMAFAENPFKNSNAR